MQREKKLTPGETHKFRNGLFTAQKTAYSIYLSRTAAYSLQTSV
ncbi:MAG TPA: hypothetical protein VHP36_08460 [Chitinispirillaceae bacterium]|nr:hypothetical protein [Chitinispirillaceae bacterium]